MSDKRLEVISFRAPSEMREWIKNQARTLCMSESEYVFIIVSRIWPDNPLKCNTDNNLSTLLAELQALVYEGIEHSDDLPEVLKKQLGLSGLKLASVMFAERQVP